MHTIPTSGSPEDETGGFSAIGRLFNGTIEYSSVKGDECAGEAVQVSLDEGADPGDMADYESFISLIRKSDIKNLTPLVIIYRLCCQLIERLLEMKSKTPECLADSGSGETVSLSASIIRLNCIRTVPGFLEDPGIVASFDPANRPLVPVALDLFDKAPELVNLLIKSAGRDAHVNFSRAIFNTAANGVCGST
jgi:hypothetical protein